MENSTRWRLEGRMIARLVRGCFATQDGQDSSGGAPRGPRRMLRLPRVKEQTGLGRSSIYRAMEDDGFPRPVRIGRRAVAWIEAEVNAWLERQFTERGNRGSGR